VVRPGSIVYSDEWRAYWQIQPKLGLQHETVNHSVNFVDPSTGVHTQNIESYWAKTKYKFKVMKGARSDTLTILLRRKNVERQMGNYHQRCFLQPMQTHFRAVPILKTTSTRNITTALLMATKISPKESVMYQK
jgi:hypothetical protein